MVESLLFIGAGIGEKIPGASQKQTGSAILKSIKLNGAEKL